MAKYFTKVTLRDGTVLTGPPEDAPEDLVAAWKEGTISALNGGVGFLDLPGGGVAAFPGDNVSFIELVKVGN